MNTIGLSRPTGIPAGQFCTAVRRGVAACLVPLGQMVVFACVVAMLTPGGAAGQDVAARFRHLTLEDGLSQNSVRQTFRDRDGFLWFVTYQGLNRYDGSEFKIFQYDPEEPDGIPGSSVAAIDQDQAGALWVGTRTGLGRLRVDGETFDVFLHDPADSLSLSHDYVSDVHVASSGTVWIATEGGGLNAYQGGPGFRHHRHRDGDQFSLSSDTVRAIAEGDGGELWLATAGGLSRLDPESGAVVRYVPDGSEGRPLRHDITALLVDSSGDIWIGSDFGDLQVLDPATDRFRTVHRSSPGGTRWQDDRIAAVYQDRAGEIWVASRNRGLWALDQETGSATAIVHDPSDPWSLGGNDVLSVYEDVSGILWVGTYSGGVSRRGPGVVKFASYRTPPGLNDDLPHDYVRAFLQDDAGNLWLGSLGGGLVRIDAETGQARHYHHDSGDPTSLSNDAAYGLHQDREGRLWIGLRGGWVNRLREDGTFKRYSLPPPPGLSRGDGQVHSFAESSNGMLWAGSTSGTLNYFDPEADRWVGVDLDLDDDVTLGQIFDVHADGAGNLWLGTLSGLWRYDTDSGVIESAAAHRFITFIEEDESGSLWLASAGNGLVLYDPSTNTSQRWGSGAGLSNLYAYGLAQSDDGSVWVSHNGGMSRFDTETETFQNYDVDDGLQSNEFNIGAAYRTPDGRLFFGGIHGYNVVTSGGLSTNRLPPLLAITELELAGRAVEVGEFADGRRLLTRPIWETDHLDLSHSDRSISLSFAALSFSVPSGNVFSYRLEGLDEEWSRPSSRRYATYANLAPGEYVFRLRGANNDGVWTPEGLALSISIAPPFWMTWWFRGLVAAGLILAVLTVFQLRVRAIRSQKKALETEVQERTCELREQKEHLEATLIELESTRDELVETAHKAGMADVATGVLHNVGNLLNSVSTSASAISGTLHKSRVHGLTKANSLLRDNLERLGEFFASEKGSRLPGYYFELENVLRLERDSVLDESKRLGEKVQAISAVIRVQQQHAKDDRFLAQTVNLSDIVEESFRLTASSMERHDVTVETRFSEVPEVQVQKTKLIHALINLYKNAKEAMDEARSAERRLTVEVTRDQDNAYIVVTDTGPGIPPETLEKVFSHGFTTKKSGHGFGLHSSANYLTEMGGRMWAESDGESGTTFYIALPLTPQNESGPAPKTVAVAE